MISHPCANHICHRKWRIQIAFSLSEKLVQPTKCSIFRLQLIVTIFFPTYSTIVSQFIFASHFQWFETLFTFFCTGKFVFRSQFLYFTGRFFCASSFAHRRFFFHSFVCALFIGSSLMQGMKDGAELFNDIQLSSTWWWDDVAYFYSIWIPSFSTHSVNLSLRIIFSRFIFIQVLLYVRIKIFSLRGCSACLIHKNWMGIVSSKWAIFPSHTWLNTEWFWMTN